MNYSESRPYCKKRSEHHNSLAGLRRVARDAAAFSDIRRVRQSHGAWWQAALEFGRRYGTRAFESHDYPRVDLCPKYGGNPGDVLVAEDSAHGDRARTRQRAQIGGKAARRRHVVGYIENPFDRAPPGVDGHALKAPREPHVDQCLADIAVLEFDVGALQRSQRGSGVAQLVDAGERGGGQPLQFEVTELEVPTCCLWPRVVVKARHHGARVDFIDGAPQRRRHT